MPEVCVLEGCTDRIDWMQIEPRYVNLTETCFVAPPEKIAAACDKNTIGVVGILGTTYSGHYEDIAGIDKAVGTAASGLCSLLAPGLQPRTVAGCCATQLRLPPSTVEARTLQGLVRCRRPE